MDARARHKMGTDGEDVLVTEATAFKPVATMEVALKIWRYDPEAGERALKQYEVDAPEWSCLLDVLDLIKDRVDGTLAYRIVAAHARAGDLGRPPAPVLYQCGDLVRQVRASGRLHRIDSDGYHVVYGGRARRNRGDRMGGVSAPQLRHGNHDARPRLG